MESKRVVGVVENRPLDSVKPNAWNPNRMTDFEMRSLSDGLLRDGWLSSQAVLVWGKDAKGKRRDVIIDGEHRWTAARELGFVEGPMVVLDGLTEAQAKALTIKMNSKRGRFDEDLLRTLIGEIQFDLAVPDLSVELGIDPDNLMRHLAIEAETIEADVVRSPVSEASPTVFSSSQQIAMLQLFYTREHAEEFRRLVEIVGKQLSTKDVSATVLECLRLVEGARS